MRKWILTALLCAISLGLRAQDPYPELGAKLEEYFTALAGENASVQSAECDFLISSCQDSLVRQYVALKIYDHYLSSHIMGDDAVAVHVAQQWFLSGAVPMASDQDLLNAQIYAEFNKSSLIGMPAPKLEMPDPAGEPVEIPAREGYSVLYFYDTGCSTCKLETARLQRLVDDGEYPLTVFAIYVGADADAWARYRESFTGVVHVSDPSMESDWQRLYGVLKTPGMFLVNPAGTIVGRGLDTPALRILLNQQFSANQYIYGEAGQMARYSQLFGAYGDTLSVNHVMEVADYLAARTFGEGDMDSFKQIAGDMLYYLSSCREEVYRDACEPFVKKYITGLPDVWNTADDKAQVVSLGEMLVDLTTRTPVGSVVPALSVHGVLRQKPCLFRKGTKEGVFDLSKLKGNPGYVVFYTGGCNACQETLAAVDALVAKKHSVKVLLIDMDALLTDYPMEATTLLETFDLSAMPYIIQLDRKGVIQHRYVNLSF